jgi:hypothetical protein
VRVVRFRVLPLVAQSVAPFPLMVEQAVVAAVVVVQPLALWVVLVALRP